MPSSTAMINNSSSASILPYTHGLQGVNLWLNNVTTWVSNLESQIINSLLTLLVQPSIMVSDLVPGHRRRGGSYVADFEWTVSNAVDFTPY